MLIAEYDYDTDIAVQREEEHEMAFAEGRNEGIAQGFSDGAHHKALETAKAMKEEGFVSALIAKITGLDQEIIGTL